MPSSFAARFGEVYRNRDDGETVMAIRTWPDRFGETDVVICVPWKRTGVRGLITSVLGVGTVTFRKLSLTNWELLDAEE